MRHFLSFGYKQTKRKMVSPVMGTELGNGGEKDAR